ncbi:MAG: hypothetical protein U0892_14940 [Pirellulales bacterium]
MSRMVACSVVLLALCGCGGVPEGQVETAKVTVTVTYKGQPVEGATVTFVPNNQPNPPSNGKSDAQGKAVLATYAPADGAILGAHKVMIAKMEAATTTVVSQDDPAYDPNAPAAPAPKSLLPKKYNNFNTSGLTAEVTKGKENTFTFELKD